MIVWVAVLVVLVPATVLLEPARALPAVVQPASLPQPEASSPEAKPEPAQETGIYTRAPQRFFVLNESTGKVEERAAEDFVRGAVAAEMPALFHPEALKAQAVAAYSYSVRQALRQRDDPDPALQGADFAADPENLKVCLTETRAREFYGEDFDFFWD